MRVKCFSVRLKSLVSISDQALLAITFDGSRAVLPKSQVIMPDCEVSKSEAWWITAWILERKDIQYSRKKVAMIDTERYSIIPLITVEKHVPDPVEPHNSEPDESLVR